MTIYPAIDLYEGKVVRLARGDFKEKTVYSGDPAQSAAEWEKQGAAWIHVVDLEGAKTGAMKNKPDILKIRRRVRCKIELGGGIRSLGDIESLVAAGIDRVVLGTKALDEKFFRSALEKFGKKIAVSLDVRGGKVRTQGWLGAGGETLREALLGLKDFPLETVIYTDIQRDGMLAGPDWEGLKDVLGRTKSRVILSGGIASLDDVKAGAQIKAEKFEGVIVGRALYEKKFTLAEAIQTGLSS